MISRWYTRIVLKVHQIFQQPLPMCWKQAMFAPTNILEAMFALSVHGAIASCRGPPDV